jgi:hypothetical protein
VKRGVTALGDILSESHGMNHIPAIRIYALLGHGSFAIMMKGLFEQEVGEDRRRFSFEVESCKKTRKRL